MSPVLMRGSRVSTCQKGTRSTWVCSVGWALRRACVSKAVAPSSRRRRERGHHLQINLDDWLKQELRYPVARRNSVRFMTIVCEDYLYLARIVGIYYADPLGNANTVLQRKPRPRSDDRD